MSLIDPNCKLIKDFQYSNYRSHARNFFSVQLLFLSAIRNKKLNFCISIYGQRLLLNSYAGLNTSSGKKVD